MKLHLFFLAAALAVLLASCGLDEGPPANQDPPAATDTLPCSTAASFSPVSFSNPGVGQKSRFLFLTGRHYGSTASDTAWEHHPDTLMLEVVEQAAPGTFKVKECVAAGSAAHPDVLFPDSALFYLLTVETGIVRPRRLPENSADAIYSRLFVTREIPLPLADNAAAEFQLAGWSTSPACIGCYQEGFCENCELLGTAYDHLNVALDNTDMAFDGHGFTWIYSAQEGLVRFTWASPWTSAGGGWEKLPD